jgi:hypothetical protein
MWLQAQPFIEERRRDENHPGLYQHFEDFAVRARKAGFIPRDRPASGGTYEPHSTGPGAGSRPA